MKIKNRNIESSGLENRLLFFALLKKGSGRLNRHFRMGAEKVPVC